jgi:2'-aminobiphenyl-2,3-diol 1,2-dioxygenase large subunit
MARITGAFMTSHILMGDKAADPQAQRVAAGMSAIGTEIQALKPDVIVIISSDHMFNITTALQPPFTVGVADSYTPFGDMDIPTLPRPGHRRLAHAFCVAAAEAGYDLAQAEEYRPDHGIAIPMMFADPSRAVPMVPLLINVNMDPLPAPRRCIGLAQVLKRTIEHALPPDQTAVVLGTGGLSHWINIPGHGQVNEAWDREVMGIFAAGQADQLANWTCPDILKHAGNGGFEIVNWMMAAATMPGVAAKPVYYEPMPQWMTGMGGMTVLPA